MGVGQNSARVRVWRVGVCVPGRMTFTHEHAVTRTNWARAREHIRRPAVIGGEGGVRGQGGRRLTWGRGLTEDAIVKASGK